MTRIYATKGAAKMIHNPSVPMNDAMLDALRERAQRNNLPVTEQIRRYINRGLEQDHGVVHQQQPTAANAANA
jgi:hypothetical protein